MDEITLCLSRTFHPHHEGWVAASFLVAVFASYVALELADRIRVSAGQIRAAWLTASAIAFGGGIWSMHFIAMLGLLLPFPIAYDLPLTGFSLVTAIMVSGIGFYVVFWRDKMPLRFVLGGVVMGLGVAAMHYLGMAALVMPAVVQYDPFLVSLSLFIAVAAATTALWLASSVSNIRMKLASAPIMGTAIAGMHFVGMAAFVPRAVRGVIPPDVSSTAVLASGVMFTIVLILLAALGLVYHDQRVQRLTQMALAQFGIYAASSENMGDVSCKAASTIRTILGVEIARIFELDLISDSARVTSVSSKANSEKIDQATAKQVSILRTLMTVNGPLRFSDGDRGGVFAVLSGIADMESGLILPVRVNDSALIAVCGFSAEIQKFSLEAEQLLQTQGQVLAVLKEREIAVQRLRLRDKALETISQGITVTDRRKPGTPIIYANPAFAAMTGYDRSAVIGMSPKAFYSPALDRAATDLYRERSAEGNTIKVELNVLRKDGSSFLDNLVAAPLSDGGEVAYHVTVHDDITDQRRRELRLREVQKLESIGQLTGGIAHEFNNLLAVIVSNAENLREDLKDRALIVQQIERIQRASDRGQRLVRQLLAFAGKEQGQPTFVNAHAILHGVANVLRRTFDADFTISVESNPDLPMVRVDEAQLEAALLNIALNARDAMPEGGLLMLSAFVIDVRADTESGVPALKAGQYVVLSVTDTGQGMTRKVLERAFVPFFTTKDVGVGKGLGLSVVHGFAQQSGGDVKIASQVGQGTTVQIYLPALADVGGMPG